jgi:DNA-binding NtrC family response regulator
MDRRTRHQSGRGFLHDAEQVHVEIHAGRFREDFYYRLCSDVLTAPSPRAQLAEAPEDLPRLAGFIARRRGVDRRTVRAKLRQVKVSRAVIGDAQ